MSEKPKTHDVSIIEQIGRTDLIDKKYTYEKKRDEHLALIDEKSGVEKVDGTLKEEEKRLEEKLRSNRKVWLKRLEELDHRTKAEWATDDVQELEEKQKEELGQPSIEPLPSFIDEEKIDRHIEYYRDKSETFHKQIVTEIKAILNDLNKLLIKYLRTKAFVFIAPKFIYLLFTLVILTIGASEVGERIQGKFLKLGFAVGLWAGQEFFVAPLYGEWLSKYRRERLKEFTRQLTDFKIRTLVIEAGIESGFKEHLSKYIKAAKNEN